MAMTRWFFRAGSAARRPDFAKLARSRRKTCSSGCGRAAPSSSSMWQVSSPPWRARLAVRCHRSGGPGGEAARRRPPTPPAARVGSAGLRLRGGHRRSPAGRRGRGSGRQDHKGFRAGLPRLSSSLARWSVERSATSALVSVRRFALPILVAAASVGSGYGTTTPLPREMNVGLGLEPPSLITLAPAATSCRCWAGLAPPALEPGPRCDRRCRGCRSVNPTDR